MGVSVRMDGLRAMAKTHKCLIEELPVVVNKSIYDIE